MWPGTAGSNSPADMFHHPMSYFPPPAPASAPATASASTSASALASSADMFHLDPPGFEDLLNSRMPHYTGMHPADGGVAVAAAAAAATGSISPAMYPTLTSYAQTLPPQQQSHYQHHYQQQQQHEQMLAAIHAETHAKAQAHVQAAAMYLASLPPGSVGPTASNYSSGLLSDPYSSSSYVMTTLPPFNINTTASTADHLVNSSTTTAASTSSTTTPSSSSITANTHTVISSASDRVPSALDKMPRLQTPELLANPSPSPFAIDSSDQQLWDAINAARFGQAPLPPSSTCRILSSIAGSSATTDLEPSELANYSASTLGGASGVQYSTNHATSKAVGSTRPSSIKTELSTTASSGAGHSPSRRVKAAKRRSYTSDYDSADEGQGEPSGKVARRQSHTEKGKAAASSGATTNPTPANPTTTPTPTTTTFQLPRPTAKPGRHTKSRSLSSLDDTSVPRSVVHFPAPSQSTSTAAAVQDSAAAGDATASTVPGSQPRFISALQLPKSSVAYHQRGVHRRRKSASMRANGYSSAAGFTTASSASETEDPFSERSEWEDDGSLPQSPLAISAIQRAIAAVRASRRFSSRPPPRTVRCPVVRMVYAAFQQCKGTAIIRCMLLRRAGIDSAGQSDYAPFTNAREISVTSEVQADYVEVFGGRDNTLQLLADHSPGARLRSCPARWQVRF